MGRTFPDPATIRSPFRTRGANGPVGDVPLWQRHWVRAAAIFVVAAAVRIPFRATYLVNWDSVNFALGVGAFDLEAHQPHPPGYLGYVFLGRIIDWFVGDPVLALTGISVVAGATATMGVYLLATRIVSERAALVAAGLFGTSPLVWYYSAVPLTYIVEVALALPLVLLVLEARKQRTQSLLFAAIVLLALMGAVRQTSLVLFFPLIVYGALAFPWKVRLRGAALLTGLVLVWLVPLMVMSGGPLNYLQVSRQLAELTGGATWLGAGAGVLQNFIVVTLAVVLGMHLALLAIPVQRFSRRKPPAISAEHRRLMMVWGIPALFTYLFVHSGQLGYVLVILPIGIIWASKVFSSLVTAHSLKAVAAAGALIVANGLGFFLLPEVAFATVSRGDVEFPDRMASNTLVQRGIQQVSLPRNDAHWETMLNWVETYDSESTMMLAEPKDGGSFRHLSFYLPEFVVYGLGTDKGETFGHLFTSDENSSDYSVERLTEARTSLDIPSHIDTILVPDPRLQDRLEGLLELDYEVLENGAVVAVAEVPDYERIVFVGASGAPGFEIVGTVDDPDSTGNLLAVPGSCPVDSELPLQNDRVPREVTAC
ncbi:MAG: ArnT family glycosyltransferase [Actinomycetota bacterium]